MICIQGSLLYLYYLFKIVNHDSPYTTTLKDKWVQWRILSKVEFQESKYDAHRPQNWFWLNHMSTFPTMIFFQKHFLGSLTQPFSVLDKYFRVRCSYDLTKTRFGVYWNHFSLNFGWDPPLNPFILQISCVENHD